MSNPALGALEFILGTVLDLYAMIVALRFIMQTVRADYYNPLAQFVVTATDPLVKPMRRIVPAIGRYDTSSLLLCYGVLLLKLLIFRLLALGPVPAIGSALDASALPAIYLLIVPAIDLVYLLFNIFIFAIVIQAILSWLPNAGNSPIHSLLHSITAPVLDPIRRFVPPMGGLDLSALVGIIGLYALRIFVVGTLTSLLFS